MRFNRVRISGKLSIALIGVLLLGILLGAGLGVWGSRHLGQTPTVSSAPVESLYQCPMHPEVTSHEPGKCPKCGMDLVKVEADTAANPAPLYQCPMHPEVTSHEPGKCPKCGMDLVKVEADTASSPAPLYQCPMHSEVTSHEPGKCPKCGMDLVKVETEAAASASPLYQCPMHSEVTSHEPGKCPKCGMDLVKVEQEAASVATPLFQCPMHPEVTADAPGKCPKCGMELVRVEAGVAAGGSIPGLATIRIDASRQQSIGLRTSPVERLKLGSTIRTSGRVTIDERLIRRVTVKVPGYVEHLYSEFIGQPIKAGQPLLDLYSPELIAAQNEYLLALQSRQSLASAPALKDTADQLVASARARLKTWDFGDAELRALETSGKPARTWTLKAPWSGVVTARDVLDGSRLEVGAAPLEITDLSRVWVLTDVYESDLPRVRLGMQALVTLKALPQQPMTGRVTFLSPTLDPTTRTVPVRIELENRNGQLRPDMLAEVELKIEGTETLTVPRDAILDSGTRQVVFVAKEGGLFEPREIHVGVVSGDQVAVTGGLKEGERVVSRASFLVDSESRLRSALSGMGGR